MIVSATDLSKSYRHGKVRALAGVDLEVNKGEIFGLIGPDGAGKTTLFRLLTTLIKPDDGTASVDGLDIVRDYRALRRRIGYMPGRFSLYQDLTVEENLRFFATIFHTTIEENYDLIKDIYRQIEPFKHRRAVQLSGGMKQKLALSCALIHAPRVLFLDEPTTGVDPVSRSEFWQMLQTLRSRHGLSIIASTPYMDEAMQCDRIALMQTGRFLDVDTPQGIIGRFTPTLWAVRSNQMHRLLGDLRDWQDAESVFSFGDSQHMTVRNGASHEALRQHLLARGHDQVDIAVVTASIEDVFITLLRQQPQLSGNPQASPPHEQ